MNPAQAKNIVIVSALGSAALASIQPVSKGEYPDVRIIVGAGLVLIVLLVVAEMQPSLAGAFALLMLISSIFVVGPEVYKILGTAVGRKPK